MTEQQIVGGVKNALTFEPVRVATAVRAIFVATALWLGVGADDPRVVAAYLAVEAVLQMFVRQSVTPEAKVLRITSDDDEDEEDEDEEVARS